MENINKVKLTLYGIMNKVTEMFIHTEDAYDGCCVEIHEAYWWTSKEEAESTIDFLRRDWWDEEEVELLTLVEYDVVYTRVFRNPKLDEKINQYKDIEGVDENGDLSIGFARKFDDVNFLELE